MQQSNGLSRRLALAVGTTMAISTARPAAATRSSAAAALVRLAEEKNAAFMRGEMDRWIAMIRIASDFTLMQPLGGPASHGFVNTPERLARMSEYFRNGAATLEVAQTYETDAMVVLVMVERQTAEVGGLPRQDWSLRVTEVYRREGVDWHLVHRHADPLVRPMTLEQTASLARGAA